MLIYEEKRVEDFEAWSGGRDTLETVIEHGLEDELNYLLDEVFPEGATDTELNDFLWFDRDFIYEHLGIEE